MREKKLEAWSKGKEDRSQGISVRNVQLHLSPVTSVVSGHFLTEFKACHGNVDADVIIIYHSPHWSINL